MIVSEQLENEIKNEIGFEFQEGPQEFLLSCPADDILYGGARGGGKSHGVLGHFFLHSKQYGEQAKGLLVRRTYDELEDIIGKARKMYKNVAEWRISKKTMHFNNGATLLFRYLDKDTDAERYQGHEYSWICIEEAGNFPSPVPVDMLRACIRGADNVKKYFLMTANPGGPGHNWLKANYIDMSPPNTIFPVIQNVIMDGKEIEAKWNRVFIPAKVTDNRKLIELDPNYISRLVASAGGQEWLLKAWLEGDWNIVAGGMFDDVWDAAVHILKQFQVPSTWKVHRAFDWGSSKPFSVGYWAVSDGGYVNIDNELRVFPKGTFIRVGEWYGWNGTPNTGLRLLESEFIEGLEEQELLLKEKYGIRRIYDGPADSAIFTVQDGKSIADKHEEMGISWDMAKKGPGSRVHAWQEVRQLLANSKKSPMESKGLFITEDCLQFKRTVPTMQRDPKNLDDVNTKAEDHICDETGYMVRWEIATIEVGRLVGI